MEAPAASGSSFNPGFGETRGRHTVELPVWIYDEILVPSKPVASRLVLALLRHGHRQAGADGGRRMWWRGTLAELGRITGASKPHLIAAERELTERGFLTVHRAERARAPHSISAPLDRPTGDNLLPVGESGTRQHGDAPLKDSTWKVREGILITTNGEDADAVTICDRLRGYGVTSPRRWVEEHGAARCAEALAYLESLDVTRFRNPAGFLHGLVTGETRAPAVAVRDDGVAAESKYTTGRLGHLVRFR